MSLPTCVFFTQIITLVTYISVFDNASYFCHIKSVSFSSKTSVTNPTTPNLLPKTSVSRDSFRHSNSVPSNSLSPSPTQELFHKSYSKLEILFFNPLYYKKSRDQKSFLFVRQILKLEITNLHSAKKKKQFCQKEMKKGGQISTRQMSSEHDN